MKKDDRIFVAGHKGLVGSAIVRTLKDRGYKRIVTKTRQECDLLNPLDVKKLFEENRIDYVLMLLQELVGFMLMIPTQQSLSMRTQ